MLGWLQGAGQGRWEVAEARMRSEGPGERTHGSMEPGPAEGACPLFGVAGAAARMATVRLFPEAWLPSPHPA